VKDIETVLVEEGRHPRQLIGQQLFVSDTRCQNICIPLTLWMRE
jgi:hypothetical protein